jgi:hypothetical protein
MILLFITVLMVCSGRKEQNIGELARSYIEAGNAHDLDKLESLTADSVVWILGANRLEGKDNVLAPSELNAGANARFRMKNIAVRGDTAEFELVERNDILRPLGIDSTVHYTRFIFADGLLVKREQWKPSMMFPLQAAPNLGRLQAWIQNSRPDAIARLFDMDGRFIFSRENGELMAGLAGEFSRQQK